MYWLVILTVEIEAAGYDDVVQCGIFDAAEDVVTAVAHLQNLVLQVRFVAREERVLYVVLAFILLLRLKFEVVRVP